MQRVTDTEHTGEVLPAEDWTVRPNHTTAPGGRFLTPHVRAAARQKTTPGVGFHCSYYSLRPRQLRRWHPGYGVTPAGDDARAYLGRTGCSPHPGGVAGRAEHLSPASKRSVRRAPAAGHREPRPPPAQLFQPAWIGHGVPGARGAARPVPLRLGPAETDAMMIRCRCAAVISMRSVVAPHRAGVARNSRHLTRDEQVATEQLGSSTPPWTVTSGLTSWAHWCRPELVMDALELAADARAGYARKPVRPDQAMVFEPIAIKQRPGVPNTSGRSSGSPNRRPRCGPRWQTGGAVAIGTDARNADVTDGVSWINGGRRAALWSRGGKHV